MAETLSRCICVLVDGSEIDLTGLTVPDAIAKLQFLGIHTRDIARTIHVLDSIPDAPGYLVEKRGG